jgi:fatty acid desaturase
MYPVVELLCVKRLVPSRQMPLKAFGRLKMSQMRVKRRLFAHSRWDAAMVGIALLEIAAVTFGTLGWRALPAAASLLLGAFCVVLNCMNYQCIAHSFIHHPYFSSRLLNRFYSVVSSIALLAPQTLYRAHHLDHHRFNNDRPDPKTGRTRDGSSTYRYSRRLGREEHVWSYALVGPLRVDYLHLYRLARKRGDAFLTWTESAVLVAYVAALGAVDVQGLLFFFLPVWYLGQAVALVHNYAEHHGAVPGNRLTDSVSCYGRLYNKLWFNEGYHQEHHFRPHVHWTQLPRLRAQMLPEAQRRVVRHFHWMNLFAPASPREDAAHVTVQPPS